MATKLTLRLDESLIQIAKNYALRNKTSLSRMISTYFKSLRADSDALNKISPLVQEISGILPKTSKPAKLAKDYKNYLRKKYQ